MKLFPSSHERTIFIAIISFCMGMAVGLLPGLDIKTIAGAVATLVAAFAGAYFAYKFNQDREKLRKQEVDLGSANKAIFTLVRTYSYIAAFNKQFIHPFKEDPSAYVKILPSLGNSNPIFKIDYDSISFLIPEGKAEILTDLAEFEELFTVFIEVIKKRNHLHLNVVQPAIEQAGVNQGSSVTPIAIDEAIGNRVSATMKQLTTDLIEIAQQGEDLSEQLVQKMHEIMVEVFPGKNVIKMQKINQVAKGL